MRPVRTLSNKVLALRDSDGMSQAEMMQAQIDELTERFDALVLDPSITPLPPSVNQLRNGSFSHSYDSWNNTSVGGDVNLECYPWFSQPVQNNQEMRTGYSASRSTIAFTAADVNTGTDTITFASAHGIITGQPIDFTTSGTLPNPLVAGTIYFAYKQSSTAIKVCTSLANALAGTVIDLTTTGAGSSTLRLDLALKEDSTTTYSAQFADWDWTTGTGRLTNSFTDISTYFSPLTIDPSYSFFAGMTLARANQYITATSDVRIGCGLYGYSTGDAEWDWINGPFEITAEVVGTVATPTSRDYVVHAVTDRGFTVQSSVLTVANAPSNADFSGGARVVLSWPQVLNYGILSYDIYRNTAGTYRELQTIVTGQLSYIDNNTTIANVGGYPAADFDKLVAFTATQEDVVAELSYSGDPLVNQWGTIPYAIRVPYNYDKADTDFTKKIWFRYYLTNVDNANGRLDIQVTDGVATNADATLTSASAQFSSTDPNMVGLTGTVTDASGNSHDFEIATVNSASSIEMDADWPFASATDCTIYINGGAPSHPILTDLVFLDYREGTGFAPNAEDISGDRGTPPVTPNGSTQGGSGSGGSGTDGGDGRIRCLAWEENVLTDKGIVLAKDLKKGMVLPFEGHRNRIVKKYDGVSDIWLIETENGVSLQCTSSKQIYTGKRKKRVERLKVGDTVLTVRDGVTVPSKIKVKLKIRDRTPVVQLSLKPDDHFLAGQGGYIVCSNLKPVEEP